MHWVVIDLLLLMLWLMHLFVVTLKCWSPAATGNQTAISHVHSMDMAVANGYSGLDMMVNGGQMQLIVTRPGSAFH